MYTIGLSYDVSMELFYLKNWNGDIKEALETITLYGDESVEFVFEGKPVETLYEISSLKDKLDDFEKNDLFSTYFNEDQKEYVDKLLELLKENLIEENI
ncbi:hypothetical protein [Bacillus vallismortis]|uniref:hypothetical protein n=1 Tax=Bacillus vallismortis TaxID=72361 RepID=UPI0002894CF5|nr:hypothetical protein [Bacillus vallismortis]MBG9768212.1 hypothetical protein [Bacillus vallismortis]QAV08707.1 hypothetical protein BV11031_08950 [Bacillus vallismortis]